MFISWECLFISISNKQKQTANHEDGDMTVNLGVPEKKEKKMTYLIMNYSSVRGMCVSGVGVKIGDITHTQK